MEVLNGDSIPVGAVWVKRFGFGFGFVFFGLVFLGLGLKIDRSFFSSSHVRVVLERAKRPRR